MFRLAVPLALACSLPSAARGQTCALAFHENGATDGTGAYSNATVNVFGARRTLLDDFTTTGGQTFALQWTHVWDTQAPGSGAGAELLLRADAGGAPGAPMTGNLVTAYGGFPTGNVFFSRPEAESVASFDVVTLPAGTYWIEATVVGTEDDFWLVRASVTGSEAWVNYEDLGGLAPASSVFGQAADLNFCLLEPDQPPTYCDPSTGSANNTSTISASGSSLGAGVSIDLSAAPPGQFCYLLIGDGTTIVSQPPGSKGDLCVVGGTCFGRYAKDLGAIDAAGTFTTDLESSQTGGPNYGIPICGGNIQAGDTWQFQYWHRQPMGAPSTFSQAISVTFAN